MGNKSIDEREKLGKYNGIKILATADKTSMDKNGTGTLAITIERWEGPAFSAIHTKEKLNFVCGDKKVVKAPIKF
jgi:hypothetical protein